MHSQSLRRRCDKNYETPIHGENRNTTCFVFSFSLKIFLKPLQINDYMIARPRSCQEPRVVVSEYIFLKRTAIYPMPELPSRSSPQRNWLLDRQRLRRPGNLETYSEFEAAFDIYIVDPDLLTLMTKRL